MCITSGPSLAPVLPLSEVRSAMRSASLWHAFASVIVCFKEPINVRLESLRDVRWEFLVSFHSAWVLKLRRYRGGNPCPVSCTFTPTPRSHFEHTPSPGIMACQDRTNPVIPVHGP